MGHSAKPRLRGLLRPVGAASARTYWVRRLAALVVLALVILVPMLATAGHSAASVPVSPPGPVTTTARPAPSSPVASFAVPSPTPTRRSATPHPDKSYSGKPHPGGHESSPVRTAAPLPSTNAPRPPPSPSQSQIPAYG
jgi:hypothetical protein